MANLSTRTPIHISTHHPPSTTPPTAQAFLQRWINSHMDIARQMGKVGADPSCVS